MNRSQRRLFPRKLLIKVGRVGSIADGREIGRRDPLVVDIVKVDILEEEVSFDIFSIGLPGTQSSSGISRQKLYHESSFCIRVWKVTYSLQQ